MRRETTKAFRVLQVIPSVSPADGGPSFAIRLIAKALADAGASVDIATTVGNRQTAVGSGAAGSAPGPAGGETGAGEKGAGETAGLGARCYSFARQSEFYKVSWPLGRWLSHNVASYDVVHIHALFSYSSGAAARAARRAGVPYVVRPLGVLNRWGVENRHRRLKRISYALIENRILSGAAAVHYTSEQEMIEATAAGVSAPYKVIPLGVPNPSPKGDGAAPVVWAGDFFERFPRAQGRQVVLFLSRLDRKKGLDILLKAFAVAHSRYPEALLVIAGDGGADFVAELRTLAHSLGIADDIIWTGFLDGADKTAAFAAASLFALPSYSENFGIAAAEALAAGLPCAVSDQVGIAPDIALADAGLVCRCDPEEYVKALSTLLGDPSVRDRMGRRARDLAASRFSLEAMGRSLIDLYDSVLRGSQVSKEQPCPNVLG